MTKRDFWMHALFGTGLLVNAWFVLPQSYRSLRAAIDVRALNNHERRLLLWGPFYRDILSVEGIIPKQAQVRFVSNQQPWYINYYLYPRLLREGSSDPADWPAVRTRFPTEWILLYQPDRHPSLQAIPPLKPESA